MALYPLYGNREPVGVFDLKDGTTLLGGEVVYLSAVTWNSTDLAAADVTNDGYTGTSSKTRPAVTLATAGSEKPVFLCDEGTAFYGTLFGTLVGANTGQTVTGGTVFGPQTSAGSGKATIWNAKGFYGISLDAMDSTVQPSIATAVGLDLSYAASGKLSTVGGAVGAANVVANFVEFATNQSLVNSPRDLVAALNSPSGSVATTATKQFTMAIVHFKGL